jgi:membrane associated rhomboid family serine protease
VRDGELYYRESHAPHTTPVVLGLLIANVAVFAVQAILALAGAGLWPVRWFGLSPVHLKDLYLWQLVTYMFLHSVESPFHILFNMLFLYWFGRDIEVALGRRRFLAFYLTAGVFAGLLFCAVDLALRLQMPVIGASGAIMAVMVLYAVYFPDRTVLAFFLFPMSVKWFVILAVALDLWTAVVAGGKDGVAYFAHLGGAAYGYVFARLIPLLQRWWETREARRESAEGQTREEEERLLDEILGKVHHRGLGALTRREKKFLVDMSRKIGER